MGRRNRFLHIAKLGRGQRGRDSTAKGIRVYSWDGGHRGPGQQRVYSWDSFKAGTAGYRIYEQVDLGRSESGEIGARSGEITGGRSFRL